MRFFGKVLPHLAVSFNIALMIVVYLDMRNPMMGFLVGTPFVTLAACACVCSIASAVTLIGRQRRESTKKEVRKKIRFSEMEKEGAGTWD